MVARRVQGQSSTALPRSPALPRHWRHRSKAIPPAPAPARDPPYRRHPGTAAPRFWGRGPGTRRSPGSRPSCARSGPGWAAGARLGKHKRRWNKLRMGTGARPAPGTFAGLTHRVAVQQKDTMGQTAVLHPQVERVGAVEVDVGLEQSTVRCWAGSTGDPDTAPTPHHRPKAPSRLRGKPWACRPRHHPRRQSSALSKSPGSLGGEQLLSSTEQSSRGHRAPPGDNSLTGLPGAEARSQSSAGTYNFPQPQTRHQRQWGCPCSADEHLPFPQPHSIPQVPRPDSRG